MLSDGAIKDLGLAESFTPPYPHRFDGATPLWALLRAYRRNMLAIFSKNDFASRQHRLKVLRTFLHLCNSPDAVRETLSRRHETFQRKTPQQRRALAALLGDGLFVSDGALWEERRAVVAPIVHGRRIDAFAPVMCEAAVEWRENWRGLGDDAEVDVLSEMGELTAEIICRAIFGRRLGREYTREIIAGFAEYQRRIDQLDLPSLLKLPDWFPRLPNRRALRAARRVHRVIDEVIGRFEAREEADENAVIASLFAARGSDGAPLSREAIRNEAIVIFMAGHETTANTLAWALYLVSQCDRTRDRLQAELGEVLAGRAPGPADVSRLRFTRAIVEETLRLYPPVPLLGRTAASKATVLGRNIAAGDLLVVAPWLLQRNRDIWLLPDQFVPERFLPEIAARPEKHAYIPFASGPRVCPGLTFGMTEAVICLATLAQAFDLRLAPGHSVEVECRLTLRPGKRLPMRLSRRSA